MKNGDDGDDDVGMWGRRAWEQSGREKEEELEHMHAHIKNCYENKFFTDTINFHMTRKFVLCFGLIL